MNSGNWNLFKFRLIDFSSKLKEICKLSDQSLVPIKFITQLLFHFVNVSTLGDLLQVSLKDDIPLKQRIADHLHYHGYSSN